MGSYSDQNTLSGGVNNIGQCTPCALGTYASSTKSVSCSLCPIGSYADVTGSIVCEQCSSGRITPAVGAVTVGACLTPTTNFTFGFFGLIICLFVAYVYILNERYYRISFKRYNQFIKDKLIHVLLLYFYLKLLVKVNERKQTKKLEERKKKAAKSYLKNLVLFTVLSIVSVTVLTLTTYILSILKIAFSSLIIWRDYQLHLDLTYYQLMKRQLERAIVVVRVVCEPIIYLFELVSSININLSAINVTCDGSKAPILLLLDFVILGITHTLTHTLTHTHTHSLTHSLTHSFTHSFTHSLTHSLPGAVTILILTDYNIILNCIYKAIYSTHLRLNKCKIALALIPKGSSGHHEHDHHHMDEHHHANNDPETGNVHDSPAKKVSFWKVSFDLYNDHFRTNHTKETGENQGETPSSNEKSVISKIATSFSAWLETSRFKFTKYLPAYFIANVIGYIVGCDPIISAVTFCMGYVQIFNLVTFDSRINSPYCNTIAATPNIDAFLGYMTAIILWLIALPVIYTVADIVNIEHNYINPYEKKPTPVAANDVAAQAKSVVPSTSEAVLYQIKTNIDKEKDADVDSHASDTEVDDTAADVQANGMYDTVVVGDSSAPYATATRINPEVVVSTKKKTNDAAILARDTASLERRIETLKKEIDDHKTEMTSTIESIELKTKTYWNKWAGDIRDAQRRFITLNDAIKSKSKQLQDDETALNAKSSSLKELTEEIKESKKKEKRQSMVMTDWNKLAPGWGHRNAKESRYIKSSENNMVINYYKKITDYLAIDKHMFGTLHWFISYITPKSVKEKLLDKLKQFKETEGQNTNKISEETKFYDLFQQNKLPPYLVLSYQVATSIDEYFEPIKHIESWASRVEVWSRDVSYGSFVYACTYVGVYFWYYTLYNAPLVFISYGGYGHFFTAIGRHYWSYVFRRYKVFLLAALFGIWDDLSYQIFSIPNDEYGISLNEYSDDAGFYDPSDLMWSIISIRSVLFLLIPYCSILCIFCKNTAGSPLFFNSLVREYNGIPVRYPIPWARPNLSRHEHVQHYNWFFYSIVWIHEYARQSRGMQWIFGLYNTIVSVGVVFDPDSHYWIYSTLFANLPLAFIASLQVIIFFGHYFKIINTNPKEIVNTETVQTEHEDVQFQVHTQPKREVFVIETVEVNEKENVEFKQIMKKKRFW